jgi:hypothetical protein
MATVTTARDQVTPTLHKGREAITETVLPAVRDTLTLAKEKGAVLLDSDAAAEAKRRSAAVLRAAKGDRMVVAPARRRWRFGIGMLAIGGGIGYGIAWLLKRLSTPLDAYDRTVTPHSNVTTTGTTADENIDLRAGTPTAT